MQTTDAGANWSSVLSNTGNALFALDFVDANIGYAAGENGTVLRTINGGNAWNPLSTGTLKSIYVATGTSNASVWCVGDSGLVLHSTNVGVTWSTEFAKTGFDLFGLHVVNDSTAWISGDNGVILKTNPSISTLVNNYSASSLKNFSLEQNYPNPFNPSTTIRYSLPSHSRVRIVITNALGQQVIVLTNGEQEAGYHEVEWRANVASGIYFYRIDAVNMNDPNNRFMQVKKMLLLR